MTLAIALWVISSVSAALWLVEHVTLALRSRGRGAAAHIAWTFPVAPCWRAGDRVGPCAWVAFLVAYVVATALSFARL